METTAFQRCYARFSCSCPDASPSVKVSSAKTNADVKADKLRMQPSCGTWMQARPRRDGSKGTDMLAKDPTSPEKPPSEPLPPGKYRRRPSVGTWLAPCSNMTKTMAVAQALPSANTDLQENKGSCTPSHLATDIGALAAVASCSEQRAAAAPVQRSATLPSHKPSIGTWRLSGPRLRLQQHILTADALAASTNQGNDVSKHHTDGATAVAASPSAHAPTTLRSHLSVGTWLSSASMLAKAVPVKDSSGVPATNPPEPKLATDADCSAQDTCHNWRQRPSVGTWVSRSAVVSDLLAAVAHQEHIEPSKKGNEIEQLLGSMQLVQPDTTVVKSQGDPLLPIPGKADTATPHSDNPCVREQGAAARELVHVIYRRQPSVGTWIVSPPTRAASSCPPQEQLLPDPRKAEIAAPYSNAPCVQEQSTAGAKGPTPNTYWRQPFVGTWIVSPPTWAAASFPPQEQLLPDPRKTEINAPDGSAACVQEQSTVVAKGPTRNTYWRQPSVGTWIVSPPLRAAASPLAQGLPLADPGQAGVATPNDAAASVSPSVHEHGMDGAKGPALAKYQRQPSVGTWLVSPPTREVPALSHMQSQAAQEQPDLESSVPDSDSSWRQRPSIGTWLACPARDTTEASEVMQELCEAIPEQQERCEEPLTGMQPLPLNILAGSVPALASLGKPTETVQLLELQ